MLGGPLGVGICRNVEMDDLSPFVTENNEDVQDTKRDCRDGEEVAGGDVGNVIVKECPSGLGRRFAGADHVFGHGRFGDIVIQ